MSAKLDLERVRSLIATAAPELLEAVDDVDRTLIIEWLHKAPWERAALSYDTASGIEELRSWRRVG